MAETNPNLIAPDTLGHRVQEGRCVLCEASASSDALLVACLRVKPEDLEITAVGFDRHPELLLEMTRDQYSFWYGDEAKARVASLDPEAATDLVEDSDLNAYDLSEDAWVILGAWFALMKPNSPRTGLTLHLKTSKPAPRTQAALDELVAKGVLTHRIRTPAEEDQGAHFYQPAVDCYDALMWTHCRLNAEDKGEGVKFSMMVPVDGIDKPMPGTVTWVRG